MQVQPSVRGDAMRKILTVFVAAVAIGAAALATSSRADAWGWGWRGGWGWGWGAPFVAGAIVGGALAAPYWYGGYGYGPYYPYGPYPYYGCRRVWNGWAWVRACY
jgi:hypothetical protein